MKGMGFPHAESNSLPRQPCCCRAMLTEKDSLIEQLSDGVEGQKEELARVAAERDAVLQLAFHKKRERHLADPNQFVLDFADSDDVKDFAEGIAAAAEEQEDDGNRDAVEGSARRKKGSAKRRNEQLPEHLPRYEVTLGAPEDKKTCRPHGARRVIGYGRKEPLEVVPAKLVFRRTGIPKLACPADPACNVVAAKRLDRGQPLQHRGSILARMWAYRSVTIPINVFDFTVSRHHEGTADFLREHRGPGWPTAMRATTRFMLTAAGS